MIKDAILKFLKLDGLLDVVNGYIETRVELVKLEVKEDMAKAMATVATLFILIFVSALIVIFISIALAIKVGEYAGTFGGFASVAGFYLILLLILILSKEAVSKRLEKQLLETLKKKK